MLWKVTTPLPRRLGQSCTAVTHSFLFPSSFNSCLVLAREQYRNKIQGSSIKTTDMQCIKLLFKEHQHMHCRWVESCKMQPQMQNLMPFLFYYTWPLFEMLTQLFRHDLYDQQVLKRCKLHNNLSWPFALLQVMKPLANSASSTMN